MYKILDHEEFHTIRNHEPGVETRGRYSSRRTWPDSAYKSPPLDLPEIEIHVIKVLIENFRKSYYIIKFDFSKILENGTESLPLKTKLKILRSQIAS